MLFNSLEFLIFFPIVTLLYFLVQHKFRWLILLVASCLFYASLIPIYLLILCFIIILDYCAGILIATSRRPKNWLILSIVSNFAILAIFKYYDFFIENINAFSGSHFILLHLILPLGLSFHTFQSVSYTMEVYRKKQQPVKHFGYYALYVMYYPQLVAGPIERPQNLFPQFSAKHPFSSEKLYQGIRLMAWGFFKKVVVADRIGMFTDGIFNDPAASNGWSFILAAVFFTIQIYADFSGYTDIAIGASKCMGIDLMENFRRPYFARNIKSFWKRWHISLTTWFRDYLYIPMGGNRKGAALHYIFILITFIASGFWHGAAWTFLIWGALHGLFLLAYEILGHKVQIGKWPALFITMFAVTVAFVFFRINSLNDLPIFLAKLRHINGFSFSEMITAKGVQFGNISLLISFASIIYMFVIERFTLPNLINLDGKPYLDFAFFVGTLLAIIFFGLFNQSNFIYFQF